MTNSNPRVRVRFAPSPTGPLHMGGVRTALYNYLFAKKHGGDFILRIEDTDQGRFVPGAEDYIMEALRWCGIEPNEGLGFGDGPYAPYRQSERKEVFGTYAKQLIESGHAYYAFDTPEEMDQLRKTAEAEKRTFSYDARSRAHLRNSLTLGIDKANELIQEGVAHVIRLKVPPGEEIVIHDLIRGKVVFQSDVVDDKVLLKADGMPTYHLAHIVDDYLMKITHAVRGEEWLPSAPAHVLIYRFLGWENQMPHYAHLPLLLKPDGNGKLSKRDGDRLGFPVFPLNWIDPTSGEQSSGYRERGYIPEAFVNMLAFLGWNPGTEQEIFSLEELAQAFSFDHIHKAGARFDPEKAKWFNEQYLRSMPAENIARDILSEIQSTFNIAADDRRVSPAFMNTAVEILKPRVQFAHEMITQGSYLFQAPTTYDPSVIEKRWKENSPVFFGALCEQFKRMNEWSKALIEGTVHATAGELGIKPGEIMQLLRVLVSGQPGGVDLMGMLELLGRDEITTRIELALDRIKQ